MTSPQSGLFISFEGIDGAGKSSHLEPLAEAFRAQGRDVCQTREPGGTELAEKIRALLLNQPMDALTEALLVFAARRDHICQVIAPSLARGEVVLCDRFTDATFAYQGAGRGFCATTLSALENMVQTGVTQHPETLLEPHLTLWFDLPPHVAAQRLQRARVPDRFEQLDIDFFSRVALGYSVRAKGASHRFTRIDADCAPTVVRRQIMEILIQKGWLPAQALCSEEP